jgi:hypothetical protein
MNTEDLHAATTPTHHPTHTMQDLPATVPVAAGLLVICAIVVLDHVRRLFDAMTLAEETRGLAALPPLRYEVPVAVIEAFISGGLLIAAYLIIRRSRLALNFAASIQIIITFDALLRITRGLPVTPAVAMLVLATLTATTMLTPSTRAWCNPAPHRGTSATVTSPTQPSAH